MRTTSKLIVDEFIENGWKCNPFDKLIPLLRDHREEAFSLALMVIDRIPQGGTFFDLTLSHLTESEFTQLVAASLLRMQNGCTEALDSVIAYASIQFPDLLTPHLRSLFSLCPNAGAYYEEWPWRGADVDEIGILENIVKQKPNPNMLKKAWLCLMATRRVDCIKFASQHFYEELDRGAGFDAYAHLAGFDISDPDPRRLHTETTHHIIFPGGYFKGSERPAWMAHDNHPTWILPSETAYESSFGGTSVSNCGNCGGVLHRLIRLDQADAILGIRLPQVDLCTCLSCLGWEIPEMFFSHDDFGNAYSLVSTVATKKPQFPAEALRTGAVAIVRSPSRWQFQDWALSNGRENLHRIGGSPSWIQDAQYPKCPRCERLMSFIAQLDSDLPSLDGSEWLWGSGGICYVFWCDPCAVSGNLWQCT